MERNEIDDLAALAQAMNEIDRRYPDLESITLKQLSELSQMHHLAIPEVMALIALIRWGRMYRHLKELGTSREREDGPIPGISLVMPEDTVQDSRRDLDDYSNARKGRHSIEFL